MPSIEDVSCWISTQASGKLPEYSEEEDSDVRLHPQSHGRAEQCYIQSEEDAEFTVSVQTDPTFFAQSPDITHLAARFRLDGVNYMPHQNVIRLGICRTIEGYRIEGQSNCYVRMRFGKLNITEEKPLAPTEGDFPNEQLGEITVLLYRYKRYYDRATTKRQAKDKATLPQIESDRTVHEKALKGRDVTHFVGGGRVVEIPPASLPVKAHAGEYVDPVAGEPYMQFTFCYRSERALKGLGLIPRTPSPSPSPSPSAPSRAELSGLSHDQLLDRVLALQSQQPAVKREAEDGTNNEGGRVKRTRMPGTTTIIDLTDD